MFEEKKKAAKKPKDLKQLETVVLGEERNIANRAKIDAKRKELAVDSEYWCSVVFPDRATKQAFIKAIGMQGMNDKYVDGMVLAELMGIKLEAVELPPSGGKIDRKFADMSLPLPEGGD